MNIQYLDHNDHIQRQYLQDETYLEGGKQDNKKSDHMRNLSFELSGNKLIKPKFLQSLLYMQMAGVSSFKKKSEERVPHFNQPIKHIQLSWESGMLTWGVKGIHIKCQPRQVCISPYLLLTWLCRYYSNLKLTRGTFSSKGVA